jgi:hypothetical protein
VYLNRVFENYIRLTVGQDQWLQIKDKSKRMMMQEFEQSIAQSYRGDNQQYSVDLLGVKDNPKLGIDDETITLQS